MEVDYAKLLERDDNLSLVQKELANQHANITKSRENIQSLIRICRENLIEPVFLTQPALFGPAIDPVSKKDLGRMVMQAGNVSWGQGLTGNEKWIMLETYNDITRKVCSEENIKVIDMAKLMPKNSLYYYDYIHFSKSGAKKMSELIYSQLCPYLKGKYSSFSAGPCFD